MTEHEETRDQKRNKKSKFHYRSKSVETQHRTKEWQSQNTQQNSKYLSQNQVNDTNGAKSDTTESSDQLEPLLDRTIKNRYFYRSYSLDSNPQYQRLLYGTSAPFFQVESAVPDDIEKQNSIVTIFAIWNTIIGSSLLAMPWSVQHAGLLMALVLMAAISSLSVYTAYRLLGIQLTHGKDDVGEVPYLCRTLLGFWAELLSRIFSFVIIFGANIVYWILMTNFLYYTVGYFVDVLFDVSFDGENDGSSNDTVLCPKQMLLNVSRDGNSEPRTVFQQVWDMERTVPIFLVLIVAPLLNFESATFFTKFNSIGTLSVGYLLIFTITKAVSWGININWMDETQDHFAKFYEKTFAATSGMLPLSLFIHNIIITVMRNNKHQSNNCRDLSIAYVLVVLTYLLIGFTFYICFPLPKTCIEDNMLNNFASWDPMTVVARIFLLFQLLTVFPLLSYMLRIQVFSAFNFPSYPGKLHVLCLNFVTIVTCVLFAIFLPRIGTVIRFTGAICGFVYIFLLPNVLYIAAERRAQKLTFLTLVIHVLIPIIGFVNLVAQFFVKD